MTSSKAISQISKLSIHSRFKVVANTQQFYGLPLMLLRTFIVSPSSAHINEFLLTSPYILHKVTFLFHHWTYSSNTHRKWFSPCSPLILWISYPSSISWISLWPSSFLQLTPDYQQTTVPSAKPVLYILTGQCFHYNDKQKGAQDRLLMDPHIHIRFVTFLSTYPDCCSSSLIYCHNCLYNPHQLPVFSLTTALPLVEPIKFLFQIHKHKIASYPYPNTIPQASVVPLTDLKPNCIVLISVVPLSSVSNTLNSFNYL